MASPGEPDVEQAWTDQQENLRGQLIDIGTRRVSTIWVEAMGFARMIDDLCAKAFAERWSESVDTQALRRAYELLHTRGFISEDEPSVTYEAKRDHNV